jgi:hypothetical protein
MKDPGLQTIYLSLPPATLHNWKEDYIRNILAGWQGLQWSWNFKDT